jgi:hypothetical protein
VGALTKFQTDKLVRRLIEEDNSSKRHELHQRIAQARKDHYFWYWALQHLPHSRTIQRRYDEAAETLSVLLIIDQRLS